MFKKLTSVAIALICVQLTCDLESILVRAVNFETGGESSICAVLSSRCALCSARVQEFSRCSVQECSRMHCRRARGVGQVRIMLLAGKQAI